MDADTPVEAQKPKIEKEKTLSMAEEGR